MQGQPGGAGDSGLRGLRGGVNEGEAEQASVDSPVPVLSPIHDTLSTPQPR